MCKPGRRERAASFSSSVSDEWAASLPPPANVDHGITAAQWQDTTAALPISGDDGQVDSRRPPGIKERATSAANTSPRLHLESVDDENVSSLPSHTIELANISPASQDQVGSLEHDSVILEKDEFDPKSD